jgi:hypothetical protein
VWYFLMKKIADRTRFWFVCRTLLTGWGVLLFIADASAAGKVGSVAAASDGNGNVRIIWTVPASYWPQGGWRIQDDKGSILVKQLLPAQPKTMESLSEADRKGIFRLAKLREVRDVKKRKQLIALASWRSISDWDFARAAGLAEELQWLAAGKRQFRIIGLDASGEPTKIELKTGPIDAHVATPSPEAPLDLRAKLDENAVQLYWQPAKRKQTTHVSTYALERDSPTEAGKVLGERGQIYDFKKADQHPVYTDWSPPVEQEVTYRVYAVDVLGRRSLPASTTLFVADYDALRPPPGLTASAAPGKVTLKWGRVASRHTAGIFIARAYLHQGPYEFIQAKALSPDSTGFVDQDVQGGTNYYYRLHAMNARGDLGPPSDPVAAHPRGLKPPPTPEKPQAEVGMTRIRLRWQAVPSAGYIIERRDTASTDWSRLNERITPEPRYDDHVGVSDGGEFEYRVTAVGQDDQESAASDSVKVSLPDKSPPPAPDIIAAHGEKGRVVLEFVPGEPQRDSRRFLVVRAGTAEELGLVLGDPLPSDARRYEDDWVEAGQTYWYRIVALDGAGNRSVPGEAVQVYVANPDIPVAAKPKAGYVDEPRRQVKLSFDAPPKGFNAIVQASVDGLHWRQVYGPAQGDTALDTFPPKHGSVRYRVLYQSGNGALGRASETTSVELP